MSTREYQLTRFFTIIHILAIICAGIFGFMSQYGPVPFAYLIVFFINEYAFNQYNDATDKVAISAPSGTKSEKAKKAKWYMLSSASLIIWLVFMIFIPQMQEGVWTPNYGLWSSLYIISTMFAALSLIGLNWLRKITSA